MDNLGPLSGSGGWHAILQSAGLLFFAFAGYARISTLGEEVENPARTIPLAVPIALGVTLLVYVAVFGSALLAVGPVALGASQPPLAVAVSAGSLGVVAPVVRVGAAVASLGVLLSLIVGVSRTVFAMASNGELPRRLSAVHPDHQVPHIAELAVGAVVGALVLAVDVRGAIGFSSFCVLTYYAITNAAAWTLPPSGRRWLRPVAASGLIGCVVLASTLPRPSVAVGSGVLVVGVAVWFGLSRRSAAR